MDSERGGTSGYDCYRELLIEHMELKDENDRIKNELDKSKQDLERIKNEHKSEIEKMNKKLERERRLRIATEEIFQKEMKKTQKLQEQIRQNDVIQQGVALSIDQKPSIPESENLVSTTTEPIQSIVHGTIKQQTPPAQRQIVHEPKKRIEAIEVIDLTDTEIPADQPTGNYNDRNQKAAQQLK